jgi:hypothetical protein
MNGYKKQNNSTSMSQRDRINLAHYWILDEGKKKQNTKRSLAQKGIFEYGLNIK